MIDIIIPAYNAHNTISKTLISICLQTLKDKVNVYIIDDCSDEDYTRELEFFKKSINIIQLRLNTNSGPGVARQYGIDHSNGEFIMFLDSDDLLYDCFSLKNIYDTIKESNADIGIGMMVEETENELLYHEDHIGCLHGKIYRRSFLEKNQIHFNNTRSSEDHSFNRLCYIASSKIVYNSDLVYLYRYNKSSITHKESDYFFTSLEWYIYNLVWTIEEAEKRYFDIAKIAETCFSSIYYVYYCYLLYFDENNSDIILLWSKKLHDKCKKYDKYLNDEEKYNLYMGYNWYRKIPQISVNEFMLKIEKYNN